jgi:hypothetical protein
MKKLLVIVLVMIPILIGIRIASSSKTPNRLVQAEQQQRQQKQQQKKERSRAVYRGLLNPHSDKIPEIAATAKEDVRMEIELGLTPFDPFAKPFNLQTFLRNAACDADAIVLGRVKGQTSRLTEDESFIYTINELDVQTVLKNNSAQSIKPGEVITAARTGGTIELQGRKITAVFKGSEPLEPELTYLLFLTFVPEKGLYVADNISYQIKNDKIVKLTTQQLETELESGKNANSFISSVRIASAMPCETAGGE